MVVDDIKGWNMLVVDDEPDNIEVVAESLEYYGITVTTATNGAEALQSLEKELPDLVLMDLSMPVLDGWATLRRIRNDDRLQTLKVIALSAHAILGDKEIALEVGFDGYITKPVNVPTLVEDIKQALNTVVQKREE